MGAPSVSNIALALSARRPFGPTRFARGLDNFGSSPSWLQKVPVMSWSGGSGEHRSRSQNRAVRTCGRSFFGHIHCCFCKCAQVRKQSTNIKKTVKQTTTPDQHQIKSKTKSHQHQKSSQSGPGGGRPVGGELIDRNGGDRYQHLGSSPKTFGGHKGFTDSAVG